VVTIGRDGSRTFVHPRTGPPRAQARPLAPRRATTALSGEWVDPDGTASGTTPSDGAQRDGGAAISTMVADGGDQYVGWGGQRPDRELRHRVRGRRPHDHQHRGGGLRHLRDRARWRIGRSHHGGQRQLRVPVQQRLGRQHHNEQPRLPGGVLGRHGQFHQGEQRHTQFVFSGGTAIYPPGRSGARSRLSIRKTTTDRTSAAPSALLRAAC